MKRRTIEWLVENQGWVRYPGTVLSRSRCTPSWCMARVVGLRGRDFIVRPPNHGQDEVVPIDKCREWTSRNREIADVCA